MIKKIKLLLLCTITISASGCGLIITENHSVATDSIEYTEEITEEPEQNTEIYEDTAFPDADSRFQFTFGFREDNQNTEIFQIYLPGNYWITANYLNENGRELSFNGGDGTLTVKEFAETNHTSEPYPFSSCTVLSPDETTTLSITIHQGMNLNNLNSDSFTVIESDNTTVSAFIQDNTCILYIPVYGSLVKINYQGTLIQELSETDLLERLYNMIYQLD